MEQQERHSYSFIAYVPYMYSYRVMSLAVPGSRESPVVVVVFIGYNRPMAKSRNESERCGALNPFRS